MTTGTVRLKPDATGYRDATGHRDFAGFSLVELLVALTICALLSGAIAVITPQARAAFDATPAALEIQQRERTAADVLARALRSAALLVALRDDRSPGETVPAVVFLEPDDDGVRFHAFRVMAVAGRGRGVLDGDQAGPSGSLRLRPDASCPTSGEVCGFSKGTVAAVVDVFGRFDVFTIASISKGANSITPSRALSRPYLSGSAVFAVSSDTYYLAEQADASMTLVRETASGAVQPIVDNVPELSFEPRRAGGVLKGVDVTVRVGTPTTDPRRVRDRTRQLSVSLRNPS